MTTEQQQQQPAEPEPAEKFKRTKIQETIESLFRQNHDLRMENRTLVFELQRARAHLVELLQHDMVCDCGSATTLAEILTQHPRIRPCCLAGMDTRKKILDAMAVVHEAVTGRRPRT